MRNPLTLATLGRFGLGRLVVFRKEVATLWHAFRHPATPWYLKVAMVGVVAYVIDPVDIIPDVIPILGWIDDLVLVPLAVALIVRLLPIEVTARRVEATVRRR